MIGAKRGNNECIRIDIDLQFEAADVTAITLSDFRLGIQWRMPNLSLTGGAAPEHGELYHYPDGHTVD